MAYWYILIGAFLSAFSIGRVHPAGCAPPVDRIECGWRGITARQCMDKGCCWDPSIPGVPSCSTVQDLYCDANVRRSNSGWNGITREECTSRHQCWDSSISNVPWCFQPKYTKHSAANCAPPSQRTNCGWGGITASQCMNRGCCWDDSIPGVPWCSHLPNSNSGILFIYSLIHSFIYLFVFFIIKIGTKPSM